MPGIKQFLIDSDNESFLADIAAAEAEGLQGAEILCSMFAKMCYRALNEKHNTNLSRTRSIPDNIRGTIDSAHLSVFEHASMSFVIDDCSRVFTHELVRHRIGTAFSQTSGRYCRLETIKMVWDPVLEPVRALWDRQLASIEDTVYLTECALGLRKAPPKPEDWPEGEKWQAPAADFALECRNRGAFAIAAQRRWVPDNTFDFTKRKQITSAIRRIAPNGQDNEIGVTLNIRALRHTIMLRTARFAEWEIRVVFDQIYKLAKEKFPLLFCDARETLVDGLVEVSGMKCQPYELSAKASLELLSDEELLLYIQTRPAVAEQVKLLAG